VRLVHLTQFVHPAIQVITAYLIQIQLSVFAQLVSMIMESVNFAMLALPFVLPVLRIQSALLATQPNLFT